MIKYARWDDDVAISHVHLRMRTTDLTVRNMSSPKLFTRNNCLHVCIFRSFVWSLCQN
jgi:hypothetical protein